MGVMARGKGCWVTGSGSMNGAPCVAHELVIVAQNGATGVVNLRDGGAAGSIMLPVSVPKTGSPLVIPLHGMAFETSCYAEITGDKVDSVTLIYED